MALWLKEFCDEELPYPQMVREAAVKGAGHVRELEGKNTRLQRVAEENYSDLLDQMDEAWGASPESLAMHIGRIEINAFLESRFVHKPTARLRVRLAEAERKVELLEKVAEAARLTVKALSALEAGNLERHTPR